MLKTFNIYNKQDKYVGCVEAQSIGDAKNKAVAKKLVAGRKQISKVQQNEYDDPYEQDWSDIYG